MIDLAKIKPDIEKLCRSMPVKRLGLFGSALTENYTPESDIDVLVLFESDDTIDYFARYFELKERLEGIFARQVDLVVDKYFKNPAFRESVEKTRTTVYEK
jgi:uncharacterized protein